MKIGNKILEFPNHKIWVSIVKVLLWCICGAQWQCVVTLETSKWYYHSASSFFFFSLFHFFFIFRLSPPVLLFSLYSSTSLSLPPLTSIPFKNLLHPKHLASRREPVQSTKLVTEEKLALLLMGLSLHLDQFSRSSPMWPQSLSPSLFSMFIVACVETPLCDFFFFLLCCCWKFFFKTLLSTWYFFCSTFFLETYFRIFCCVLRNVWWYKDYFLCLYLCFGCLEIEMEMWSYGFGWFGLCLCYSLSAPSKFPNTAI